LHNLYSGFTHYRNYRAEKIAMLIEENKKQLVITSTVAPNSMEVSSTLQERLQWGLTTNMTSQNQ
ncbi:DnaA/Hda family protein, partial [uncultured Streptococcus sp.]|uniref:DnaA/Hda family protein n=1 Tax=uncultured Streptococcus sp. TaxID=83427 RepID=UPI0026313938